MKRGLSALVLAFVAGTVAAADIGERLKTVLSGDIATSLANSGQVQKSSYREPGAGPTLAPSTTLGTEAVGFWAGKAPAFFVETLYLYKKKPGTETAPGGDIPRISVILRSLSKLEGIEYYSTSRKKMRTLYSKSYTIDNSNGRRRIADQTSGSADGLSVLALQKDLTFGEYIYRYSYRENADSVAFFSQNAEPMNYTVVKVLDTGRLRVSLIVQDFGDFLLVYGLTRADFPAVPAIEGHLNSSFTTRAEAVYKWFIREYEKQ